MTPVTPHQFAVVRVALGAYVLAYCLQLLPHGHELFSVEGMVPDPHVTGRGVEALNVLAVWGAPPQVSAFLVVMAAAAAAFMAGVFRPALGLLLWYGWACMDNRNIFMLTPSLPYIGWMLLACALIPSGEPWRLTGRPDPRWTFPALLWWGAWAILALGYAASGFGKLGTPSWLDGSILAHLVETPLWRDWWLAQWVASWPAGTLRQAAWATLALEVLFAPLALPSRARPWVWTAMVGWHASLLVLVDLAYISVGMLLIHLWTFDARWMPPRPAAGEPPVVFFDGVCGLCNRFLDFLLVEDAGRVLRYAPLQGETAAGRLPVAERDALLTLVYADEAGSHYRSDAGLRILDRIGGMWRPAAWLLRIIPRPLRDAGYRLIAGNRYRVFGRRAACRLPSPDERGRLLP